MTSSTEKARYYIRDPRQQTLQGKPDGGWLKEPPAPAAWVRWREQASTFTLEEIEALKKLWPYLEGCEMVQGEAGGGGQ